MTTTKTPLQTLIDYMLRSDGTVGNLGCPSCEWELPESYQDEQPRGIGMDMIEQHARTCSDLARDVL